MIKKILLLCFSVNLSFAATHAAACMEHMYFNPESQGMMGEALMRMSGLAAPKPVIELDHPATARAILGEPSEITIEYKRPWRSKNVRLEFTGTRNVEIIDEAVKLKRFSGKISARFMLKGSGFDSITVRVTGEHKGVSVSQSSVIYLRAKKPATEKDNSDELATR